MKIIRLSLFIILFYKQEHKMKKLFLSTFYFAFVFFLTSVTWSADFCVNNASDLQIALTAASSNTADDLIKVVQGTYSGNFTYYQTDKIYSITIEGGYTSSCAARTVDPANTILDAGGSGSALNLQNYNSNGVIAGNISVSGFTLQNGGGGTVAYGAGVYAVSQNSSSSGNMNSGDVTITDCIVRENDGTTSGGLHASSDSTHGSSGNVVVANNIVTDNSSGLYGGGIFADSYAYYGTAGTVTLYNNIIKGNTVSGGGGGGIYVSSSFSGTLGVINIINNTIIDNSASSWGGGAYLNANYGSGGYINVYNNIIRGNTATSGGGDIFLNSNYQASGYNNDYSSLSGTWNNGSGGNINLDPRLNNTYHLRPGSPCIDTGNNSAPSLPSTDIDGDNRSIDGNKDGSAIVDMGADEYVPKGILSFFLLLFD